MPNPPMLHVFADSEHFLGHKMRCHALAEEYSSRGGIVVNWGNDVSASECVFNGIVVIDGYYLFQSKERTAQEQLSNYREAYIKFSKQNNLVVVLNDHAGKYYCNVFINHNYRAEKIAYDMPNTRLLLGSQYFLLRSIYRGLVATRETGLFDADAQDRKCHPEDFARNIAKARAVFCSAGTTVYEALSLGKPVGLRLSYANQKLTYDNLIADRLAVPAMLMYMEWLVSDKAISMGEIGKQLIDGQGPRRVVDAILEEWK